MPPEVQIAQAPRTDLPAAMPTSVPEVTPEEKDDLGEIRFLPRPAQQPLPRRQPDLQLLLRSGVFTSSNITALNLFQPGDTVFVNTATLLATPQLGPKTRLIATAGGGLVRFANRGDFNYDMLNFSTGIQQRLTSGTYGQLGWTQDRLYRSGNGDKLLVENAAVLAVGRQDQIGKNLRLDSFYELRASFAEPEEQSRVANTAGLRLRYDITPQLQGALDYRISFKNYTQVARSDTEHQVSAQAIYNITPDLFVAGSVSYLFGRSSSKVTDLDNLSVGLNVGFNLPLL